MTDWEQPQDTLGLPVAPEGYRWNLTVSSGIVFLELQMRIDMPAKLFKKAETHWRMTDYSTRQLDRFHRNVLPLMAEEVLKKKADREEETRKKMEIRNISHQLHNAGDLR